MIVRVLPHVTVERRQFNGAIQAHNQLGTPGGEEFSEWGPIFFKYAQ